MAVFRQREEFHYFVEQKTRTFRPSPPPPPLHKKLAYDGELHNLPRCKNIFDHDVFLEYAAAAAGVGEVRSTIDSKEAAERYGGISVIDYWITKKPAAATAAFRFRN